MSPNRSLYAPSNSSAKQLLAHAAHGTNCEGDVRSPFYRLAKHAGVETAGSSADGRTTCSPMTSKELRQRTSKGLPARAALANAHTPSPLCTPSRFAILTGRHASCHFHREDTGPAVTLVYPWRHCRPNRPQWHCRTPPRPATNRVQHQPSTLAIGERKSCECHGECSTPTAASYLVTRIRDRVRWEVVRATAVAWPEPKFAYISRPPLTMAAAVCARASCTRRM